MSIDQTKEIPSTDNPCGIENDYEQFVTEDDTPLESVYQEKQLRLLGESLHTLWQAPPEMQP